MTLNRGQYVQLTQTESAVGQPDHVEQADRRVRRSPDHVDRSLLRRSRRADARRRCSALGYEYVAAPHARSQADGLADPRVFRIYGAVDGTQLTYDPPSLGAGDASTSAIRSRSAPTGAVHRDEPGHRSPVRDVHVHDRRRRRLGAATRTGSAAGAIPTSCASCRRRSTWRTTCSSPIRPIRSPTLTVVRAEGQRRVRRRHARLHGHDPRGRLAAGRHRRRLPDRVREARRSLERPERLQQRRPRHGLDAAVRRLGVGLGQRGHQHRLGQLRLSGGRSACCRSTTSSSSNAQLSKRSASMGSSAAARIAG